jgi:hypothetical protein
MPFIALGVVYDRAPAIVRPLVRHGRTAVSFIGGMLVAFHRRRDAPDLLTLLPRYIQFNAGV